MFDFDTMIRRALEVCHVERPILATPYDIPSRVCLDLIDAGLIDSIIVDSARSAVSEPWCGGWWLNRERGDLHLKYRKAATLMLVGVDRDSSINGQALLEARLKGVSRIVAVEPDGTVVEDVQVEAALHHRLDRLLRPKRVEGPTYEEAFESMYRLVGDALRLSPQQFSRAGISLCVGSLGPGGAERQAAYTAAGVKAARPRSDVTILCNHLAPPADFFRPYVEERGVRVLCVEEAPIELQDERVARARAELGGRYRALNFDSIFVEVIRYANLLRAVRPSILHSWMDYCNALCGAAAHLVGVPHLLLGCRSVAPDNFRIFQPYMRPAYRELLKRRAAMILNNSRAGADDYARWLAIDRGEIRVVHNGYEFPEIDWVSARKKVRDEHGIAPDATVVGSILRFSEEKRPRLMIDTAARVLDRLPGVRFLFFGSGSQLEEMRELIRQRGLDPIVRLPGLTGNAWEALASMDLFLLTSRMEGLPNVLIEAQAAGLPVVCTGVGGMSETFLDGATGLSVGAATAEALASAAAWILESEERKNQMRIRAISHAHRSFGIETMIEGTLAAYDASEDLDSKSQRCRA